MNRLKARFTKLQQEHRKALIAYLVAGDPGRDETVSLMHSLVEGGADVIELGVPFTDPIADGPTIQAACERALKAGTKLRDVFAIVEEFRKRDADTPIVLMGYLNPLESMGYGEFAARTQDAGADAVLVVDLPVEEADSLSPVLREAGLEAVFLISPTTREDRLGRICEAATGFVYYVSLKGVTGAGGMDLEAMAAQIARIRSKAGTPVGVGFGISDAETAIKVSTNADAVIIGSAIVKHIASQGGDAGPELVSYLAEIRAALDKAYAA